MMTTERVANDRWMTAPEAAARLGVPVRTLYDWCKAEKLPSVRIGRRVLLLRETIETIIDRGRPW